ncbi:MAG: transketolase [Treponema sp.]|nr:transketolase [Treponema sp.]
MSILQREAWMVDCEKMAQRIRLRVYEYVIKNRGGYLSQACSSAETFAVLYSKVMKLAPSKAPMIPLAFQGVPGPDNPNYLRGGLYNGGYEPDCDTFIFSPAHYALVLYTALIETGRLDPSSLQLFNKDGSVLEMISAEHSPGADTTTGSLAQAISQAAGMALGRRLLKEKGRVWVFMSDGEFQEGQVWETVQILVHYKLDTVGVYVDVNSQQCDGKMADVLDIGDLRKKLEAFGCRAVTVDGHDVAALAKPAGEARDGRPLFVLAKTDPARGVELFRERAPKLHYLRFTTDEEFLRYKQDYERLAKEYASWK